MDKESIQLLKMFATYAGMVNARIAALEGRASKLEATIFQDPHLTHNYELAAQKTTTSGPDASLQRQLEAIRSMLPLD